MLSLEEKKKKRKEYYLKNKEKIKNKHKEWGIKHPGASTLRARKWRKNHPLENREAIKKQYKIYKKKYPEKILARELARKIDIPLGTLCEICKESIATEKHHKDYNMPYKINFLCMRCHKQIHRSKLDEVKSFFI